MSDIDPEIITLEYKDNAITIRIKGFLHFKFRKGDLVGVQTWVKGEKFKKYIIEYTFRDRVIICEYDTKVKWKRILALLDEYPLFAPDFE